MNLKDKLRDELSKDKLKLVPTSFDILGSKEKSIAIVDIPEELDKEKEKIAQAIMEEHKNVESVLNKKSKRKGKFRLRDYEVIKGEKDTTVIHKENGYKLLLDPRKTYFSTREGTERNRITDKVKDGENVMVFFAGVGPFAIAIAKHTKAKRVIGIELNPHAIKYFEENVKLNKLENVKIIEGDVKVHSPQFYQTMDRVVMPLPESSDHFIKDAIKCLKKNGVCHYYCICTTDELKKEKEKIKNAGKVMDRSIEFLNEKEVKQWGPEIYKMRIDFKVK